MEDVRRRIPHTTRRKGIYYFQRRVPADLVEAFGFDHFKESLGTADPPEAERRLAAAEARYFEAIDAKRQQLESGAVPLFPPAPLKINALKLRMREYLNAEFVRRRYELQKRHPNRSRDLVQIARAEAQERHRELCDPAGAFTIERMEAVALSLFPENEFNRPEKGATYNLWHAINGPFRHYLRWTLLKVEERTLSFLDGDPSGATELPAFLLQVPAKASEPPTQSGDALQVITLAELSKARLGDHAKGSVRAQRKAQLAAAHAVILRYFGKDTRVNAITPDVCVAFRDLIARLPTNLTKRFSEEISLDSIVEAAADRKIATLGRATQETYLGALRDLMEWGVKNWKLTRNPAAGLKSLTPAPTRVREDYTEADLIRIFSQGFLRDLKPFDCSIDDVRGLSEATRYWVPRIALYTGMRQSEICQLDVSDLRFTQNGTLYFYANDEDAKSLKNKASKKAVPVHARLMAAGFQKYIKSVQARGQRKLFPDATPSKSFGHHGEKISKWFNRKLRAAQFPKRFVFHAFRHTFRQALRFADASEDVAGRLGGWSTRQGEMEKYGGGLSDKWIDHINETLQRITYGDAEVTVFRTRRSPPASRP